MSCTMPSTGARTTRLRSVVALAPARLYQAGRARPRPRPARRARSSAARARGRCSRLSASASAASAASIRASAFLDVADEVAQLPLHRDQAQARIQPLVGQGADRRHLLEQTRGRRAAAAARRRATATSCCAARRSGQGLDAALMGVAAIWRAGPAAGDQIRPARCQTSGSTAGSPPVTSASQPRRLGGACSCQRPVSSTSSACSSSASKLTSGAPAATCWPSTTWISAIRPPSG